ncbi:glycosyltransferase family 4 protein [Photobacterium phosphoreum]|uniref:glycosyltransferase family 4 protein n=1 Tax=Photobacterium phosphoreum TaxID=659 RepID=UPI000D186A28|nr:glycosyltransferase family 4 protein [Photobacterium phosphoreum]PSU34112.1 glycosyltransferase family 1 protein [Photobacterium phosphoreum]
MKKLLFVINADWYFNLHWKERAINAVKNGYNVFIAMPSCSEKLKYELESDGIVVYLYHLDRTSLGILGEVRSIINLNKVINKVSPDIIHSVTIKPNLYCTILTRIKKIQLVSTYAGLGTLKISNSIKYRLSRSVIFNIIKLFSKSKNITALFENNEDLEYFKVNGIYSECQLVRVFGAGVNLDSYPYVAPVKNRKIKVLFASRLLKDKGLDVLVSAVRELKLKKIPIELCVAGIFDFDSPLSFTEEEIKKYSNNGDILWLGQCSNMAKLISQCDIVALPTMYGEGVPRILIEACAIGRPIITTPLGGCKDICIDNVNGFIVEPNDINTIIIALNKLCESHNLIEKFGLKGRELVTNNFSNESVFLQNLFIYKKLLS